MPGQCHAGPVPCQRHAGHSQSRLKADETHRAMTLHRAAPSCVMLQRVVLAVLRHCAVRLRFGPVPCGYRQYRQCYCAACGCGTCATLGRCRRTSSRRMQPARRIGRRGCSSLKRAPLSRACSWPSSGFSTGTCRGARAGGRPTPTATCWSSAGPARAGRGREGSGRGGEPTAYRPRLKARPDRRRPFEECETNSAAMSAESIRHRTHTYQ